MSRLRKKIIENILSRLPDEIIENILSWLPVKYISRFKCVSKNWCILFQDPNFIKLHLKHAIQMNRFNLLISNHQRLFTEPHMFFIDHNVISSSASQSLSSPFLGKAVGNGNPFMSPNHVRRKYCKCVPHTFGSCNGLVCIKPCHDTSTICIWNRSTKEFKQVPATPIEYPPDASGDMESRGIWVSYGFGYDCKVEDYKLLRIVGIQGECVSEARVYTLGLNSWKSLGFIPYTSNWYRQRGLLVDGVLHWIAIERIRSEAPPYVVSFDICDETFRYTPFPDKRFATHDWSFLGIWEGKLCLILYHDQDNDVVWTMKDYTWTKHLYIRRELDLTYGRAIQTFQNGEVFFTRKEGSEESLISYDPKLARERVLKIHGLPYNINVFFGTEPYIETLVSLNSGTFVGRHQIEEEGSSTWSEDVL